MLGFLSPEYLKFSSRRKPELFFTRTGTFLSFFEWSTIYILYVSGDLCILGSFLYVFGINLLIKLENLNEKECSSKINDLTGLRFDEQPQAPNLHLNYEA